MESQEIEILMSPCVNWVVLLFLGKSTVMRLLVLAFSWLVIFPFFSLLIRDYSQHFFFWKFENCGNET
jgi:hypothetical protein